MMGSSRTTAATWFQCHQFTAAGNFQYLQPVAPDRCPADDPVGAQQREDPLQLEEPAGKGHVDAGSTGTGQLYPGYL